MADINTGKKGAPRVDLTAMVDLGFLLITFFMLTTTMAKPKTMEINKPKKDDKAEKAEVKLSKTMSILLGRDDRVYWYVAPEPGAELKVDSTDFSANGIRGMIRRRQDEVATQWGHKDSLIVLIKGIPAAKYRNMVNILDEMAITGVQRYALQGMDINDSTIVQKVLGNEGLLPSPPAPETANGQ